MYAEFVIIFVLLGIIAVLIIATMIMQIVILKKLSSAGKYSGAQRSYAYESQKQASDEGGVAFCQRCATRYNAASRVCPKCGMPR